MGTKFADLPEDVQEVMRPVMLQDVDLLSALGVVIGQQRDEAKAARVDSGIETVWRACEEAYVGIDEANRDEFAGARWSKPMSMTGPVTTDRKPVQPNYKSTVFIRMTARYVDAAAAKLGEILLPPDDKPFSFSEMPVPELIKAKEDNSQVLHDGMGGVPLTRQAKPGEALQASAAAPAPPIAAAPALPVTSTAPVMPAAGSAPSVAAPGPAFPPAAAAPQAATAQPGSASGQPQVPLTVKDLAEEHIEIARKKAKLAEKRIYDWMVDCQYTAQMRKVLFDAARLGVGVLKGPVPKVKRSIAVEKDGEGVQVQIQEKLVPIACWVDPWNIFPDPACGENINDGDWIFERDHLSPRQLRDLKEIPGYIASQIDMVLEEGPDKANISTEDNSGAKEKAAKAEKNRFEIWYRYGIITRDNWDAICSAGGVKKEDVGLTKDQKEVYAIVSLVNDRVIRATINPLDSGQFPYHSFPWQRRAGSWAGVGVGEQVTAPQKMINAATRATLNNAGKSAGSQVVVNRGAISPADGNWAITPDKIWNLKAESAINDVRQAMQIFEIPNVTNELMVIIKYAMQLAEESTSIPLITQGQSGETTPETLGATALQNSNANQLLRSVGYGVDDFITEPVVRQFYEWFLLDPDVPDEEKGEFTINAHGSIALVERAIMDQTIAQMGPLTLNPAYGGDPKKWYTQFLKSKRLAPEDFQYTAEQQAKIDANPVVPVQVQVAKTNQDTDLKVAMLKGQGDTAQIASDERIEAAANALENNKAQVGATVDLHDLETRRQLAILEYANRHQMNLDQVKADLAKTAMTLNTQERLNTQDNAVELRKHRDQKPERPRRGAQPPGQVPGKAGDGRGFEQGPPQ